MNILFLVGISGAGKSSWVKDFLAKNPNYLCVNRDSLRLSIVRNLEGYYERPDLNVLEQVVNGLCKAIFEEATIFGKDLVVDNTNLKFSYFQPWIKSALVKNWEYKLFDVHPMMAKYRVVKRDFVGSKRDEDSVEDLLPNVKYIDHQAANFVNITKFLQSTYPEKELK